MQKFPYLLGVALQLSEMSHTFAVPEHGAYQPDRAPDGYEEH